jgi:chloride channel protein, CIC family
VVDADSTKIVVVLLVAKFLGYGVSLGCGFRGGPIFPAVFLGVALASLPVVWFDTSPTVAIAIGAAAGMAAQTRLLISPLLFASLLVGTQGLDTIPAAVLATAAAWVAIQALDRRLQPQAAAA